MLSVPDMFPTGTNGRYMSSTSRMKVQKFIYRKYCQCVQQLYLYSHSVVADAFVEGPAPPEVDEFNVQK